MDEDQKAGVLQRVKAQMKQQKINQTELAQAVGLSETQMSRLLTGQRKMTAAELGAIADALKVRAGTLLGDGSQGTGRALAVAARLGQADNDDANLHEPLGRAQVLLELKSLLSRLVSDPERPGLPEVEIPTTTHRKQAGAQLADNLRAALDLGDAAVDDLVYLVEHHLGADVSLEPLPDGIHGLLITDPDVPFQESGVAVMLVNSDDIHGRQRYTLAHEVAHLFFDDAELFLPDYAVADSAPDERGRWTDRQLCEMRANSFASAFLAPEGGVRRIADNLGPAPGDPASRRRWRERLVANVAHEFGMSVEAAAIRCEVVDLLTAEDKDGVLQNSATAVMTAAGFGDELASRQEDQSRVFPPPGLRDQALFAYMEGMIGIMSLAQLWRTEDTEGLRTQLHDSGWVPAYATG